MNDKLARLLGLSPSLLSEMGRASSLIKEYDSALARLKDLTPPLSSLEEMYRLTDGMKAADLLPAFAKASDQISQLRGFDLGEKARDLQNATGYYATSRSADFLAEHDSVRKQFEAISGGVTGSVDEMQKVAKSLGFAMDSSALQLVRDQRSLIDEKTFGGMLGNLGKLDPLGDAINPDWGIPLWRPSFERLANVSLARDIGIWHGWPIPSSTAEEPGNFVSLRSAQAEDDAAQLDELVLEALPGLRQPIEGARSVLERQPIDYRTHFGASARKAIDLTLKAAAPSAEVSAWVQSDPMAPKRKKGGRENVTFRERVSFVFRNAPESARAFFQENIREIVILREELSSLDHDNADDPHPRLVENRQLVERLVLQILLEHRRSSSNR